MKRGGPNPKPRMQSWLWLDALMLKGNNIKHASHAKVVDAMVKETAGCSCLSWLPLMRTVAFSEQKYLTVQC